LTPNTFQHYRSLITTNSEVSVSETTARGLTDEQVGQRVRELREQRGFSQQHVAMTMTMTRGHRWHQTTQAQTESGQRPLRLTEAVALADVLGVRVDELTQVRGTWHERGLAIGELQRLAQQIEDRVRELQD
jgi:transcriptional regulator with XRE-family HTH domain